MPSAMHSPELVRPPRAIAFLTSFKSGFAALVIVVGIPKEILLRDRGGAGRNRRRAPDGGAKLEQLPMAPTEIAEKLDVVKRVLAPGSNLRVRLQWNEPGENAPHRVRSDLHPATVESASKYNRTSRQVWRVEMIDGSESKLLRVVGADERT